MVRVKIYAEGGGEGQLLDTLFRQGWNQFFKSAGLEGRMPYVIRGQGRTRTFDLFVTAVTNRKPHELPLLLVDSEDPVRPDHTVWQHLKTRDNWDRPGDATDDQAFLMVQIMETWFIADRDMLRSYFGADFRESHLRQWPDLEAVPKTTVLDALARATAACGKPYAKGRVSFELMATLDANMVEETCPRAKALLDHLRNL